MDESKAGANLYMTKAGTGRSVPHWCTMRMRGRQWPEKANQAGGILDMIRKHDL